MGVLDGSVAFAREWRERRERQRMRSDDRVRARNEAKEKLAEVLAPLYRGDVDAEVVIRDADRDDGYPRPDEGFRLWRRTSPWFKAELLMFVSMMSWPGQRQAGPSFRPPAVVASSPGPLAHACRPTLSPTRDRQDASQITSRFG